MKIVSDFGQGGKSTGGSGSFGHHAGSPHKC